MKLKDTTKAVVRAMAPGVAAGLVLRFVPDPAGEWIARTLVFAACGAILTLSWWMWRRTREMVAEAREARALTERLRGIIDERERWTAATLAVHRRAREYFTALGHRELAAKYDALIAGMEGRSHSGAVN